MRGVYAVSDLDAHLRSAPVGRLGPADFGAWVEPHLAVMGRLAARLAPEAERDDIVQEALERAWRKRHQFDPNRGSPAAWLCAITKDQALKAGRRRRDSSPLGESAERPISSDDRLDVEHALGRLTDRQRLAVDCLYFVGLTVAETSVVMGCAEGTVKSTLSDARSRLKTLLEVSP